MKFLGDILSFLVGWLIGSRRNNRHRPDLFRRKIVITIRWWEVIVLLAAIVPAVLLQLTVMTNVFCLAVTIGVLFTGWRMKQQAQDLRYEVHRILTNIENQDIEEEKGYQDWTETEDGAPKIGVKDLNGKRYSRISESS